MPNTLNVTPITTTITVERHDARDAYELALAEGYVGTRQQWLASLSVAGPPLSAAAIATALGYTPVSPTASPYATTVQLNAAISSRPIFSQLAAVAFNGDYAAILNKPAPLSSATITAALTYTPANAANVTANSAAIATKAPLQSPALVTPNLDTPTAGILTNCTGLPAATGLVGILPKTNGGTGTATNGQMTLLSDVKSNNATGDAIPAGAWKKATLQTKVDPSANFTVTNSVITATRAGTFFVNWSVPFWQTLTSVTRLRRINNTPATLLLGTRVYVNNYYEVTVNSIGSGFITLNAGDQLELQCFTTATGALGWNVTSADGEQSIYSTMSFRSE